MRNYTQVIKLFSKKIFDFIWKIPPPKTIFSTLDEQRSVYVSTAVRMAGSATQIKRLRNSAMIAMEPEPSKGSNQKKNGKKAVRLTAWVDPPGQENVKNSRQVVIFGVILPFYNGQNGPKFSQNRSGQAGGR